MFKSIAPPKKACGAAFAGIYGKNRAAPGTFGNIGGIRLCGSCRNAKRKLRYFLWNTVNRYAILYQLNLYYTGEKDHGKTRNAETKKK